MSSQTDGVDEVTDYEYYSPSVGWNAFFAAAFYAFALLYLLRACRSRSASKRSELRADSHCTTCRSSGAPWIVISRLQIATGASIGFHACVHTAGLASCELSHCGTALQHADGSPVPSITCCSCHTAACYCRSRATIVILFFAAWEGGGYTARVLFAQNHPPLRAKYLSQLIIIIICPNIAQGFLYVITSRLIRAAPTKNKFLNKFSKWLPAFFIISDIVCLAIQSWGGGRLASISDSNAQQSELRTPQNILLTGIALQLGFLCLFLIVFWWFILSLQRSVLLQLRKVFVGVTAAVILVTVRNAYRCAEFAQYTGNNDSSGLGSKEVYFCAGDSILMLLLCLVLLVSHLEDARVYEKLELQRDAAKGSDVFDMSAAPAEPQQEAKSGPVSTVV
jgi:RTA1 like protein